MRCTTTHKPRTKRRTPGGEYLPKRRPIPPGYLPIPPFWGTSCLAASPLPEPFYRQFFIIREVMEVLKMRNLLGNVVFVKHNRGWCPQTHGGGGGMSLTNTSVSSLNPRIKSQSQLADILRVVLTNIPKYLRLPADQVPELVGRQFGGAKVVNTSVTSQTTENNQAPERGPGQWP
jgi:hypothetical protein